MMKNVISGVMYLTFTNPEPNMLRFVTEERRKGWKFESNLTFSPMGNLLKSVTIRDGTRNVYKLYIQSQDSWRSGIS